MKQSRIVIENEFSITVLLNEKLEPIYRSPSFEKILGWTPEELIAMVPGTLVHPDDVGLWQLLIEETKTEPGKECHAVIRIKNKAGNYLWMEKMRVNRLNDPDCGAIVINMHDITRYKEKEKELNKNMLNFNKAQSIGHVGNWELDFSKGYAIWSEEHCRIYGLETDDNKHTYESWLSLIHPQDLAYVKHEIATAKISFSKSSIHHRILLKDGSVKYLLTECRYEFNAEGNPIGMYGIAHDETDKVNSKNKLIHNEMRMKEAQALAHVGHWELDFNTGIGIWSDESLKIYGLGPDEYVQSYDSWLSFIHPEDMDYVMKVIKDGEKDFRGSSFVHRIIKKDGTIRWIHSQSRFDFDKDRKLIGLHGVSHDITEAKEAEDKIMAQLEILREISSMQSHQVRSPISSLLGLINLIDFDNPSSTLNFEIISKVKIVGEKLDETIHNIVSKTNEVEILNGDEAIFNSSYA